MFYHHLFLNFLNSSPSKYEMPKDCINHVTWESSWRFNEVLDCRLDVNEFELQPHYYIHFWTNTHGEKYEYTYPLSYGLNCITAELLQGFGNLALNKP